MLANNKLVVVISSRALFDLEESHKVFVEQGIEAYCRYQVERENQVLKPGAAFGLVKKLLAINALPQAQKGLIPEVEVILLSRNSADTGLRVFNSIEHYQLPITRAAFTNGVAPYPYVRPFGADLFLSTEAEDVRSALLAGYAAASLLPREYKGEEGGQVRIAFDGDAVLFSDASERIYKSEGLDAFQENEKRSANVPLEGGPFKAFLQALAAIQMGFAQDEAPITTALVTARGAPAHERVIKTLRDWNIRIDQALFLGGMAKGEFLKTFGADIFFDDQSTHIASAHDSDVPSGHVVHGVANEVVV